MDTANNPCPLNLNPLKLDGKSHDFMTVLQSDGNQMETKPYTLDLFQKDK